MLKALRVSTLSDQGDRHTCCARRGGFDLNEKRRGNVGYVSVPRRYRCASAVIDLFGLCAVVFKEDGPAEQILLAFGSR